MIFWETQSKERLNLGFNDDLWLRLSLQAGGSLLVPPADRLLKEQGRLHDGPLEQEESECGTAANDHHQESCRDVRQSQPGLTALLLADLNNQLLLITNLYINYSLLSKWEAQRLSSDLN